MESERKPFPRIAATGTHAHPSSAPLLTALLSQRAQQMPPILFPGMRAPPARMPVTVTMKMALLNSPGVALLGQAMKVGALMLELLAPTTTKTQNLRHS